MELCPQVHFPGGLLIFQEKGAETNAVMNLLHQIFGPVMRLKNGSRRIFILSG